jgi:hypothetical protein
LKYDIVNKKLNSNTALEDEFLFELSHDEKFIILVTKSTILKFDCSNIIDPVVEKLTEKF